MRIGGTFNFQRMIGAFIAALLIGIPIASVIIVSMFVNEFESIIVLMMGAFVFAIVFFFTSTSK